MSSPLDAASLDPNKVSPGLLGFIIVVIIGLVTWFLAKSMAKQLRKLDASQREALEQAELEGLKKDDAAPNNTTAPNGAH